MKVLTVTVGPAIERRLLGYESWIADSAGERSEWKSRALPEQLARDDYDELEATRKSFHGTDRIAGPRCEPQLFFGCARDLRANQSELASGPGERGISKDIFDA